GRILLESFYASHTLERRRRSQPREIFKVDRLPEQLRPAVCVCMMRYGLVVLTAGFTGLLSFSLLAVAIGTDYWYIIDVNKSNHTGPDDLSSHSGLWRINEVPQLRPNVLSFVTFSLDIFRSKQELSHPFLHSKYVQPVGGGEAPSCNTASTVTDAVLSHPALQGLHKVVVIVLPLSLVLLVFGWIFGLVSSLASSPNLLAGSASYFLFCSLFTLTGVSIYIKYSNQAMEEFQRLVSPENLANVNVSFGWSLATAWLSYGLEVATGLLLMLAARITQMKGHYDSGVAIAML
ncbi:hypothetical protein L3Q82_014155, partial [Scortum barcoo]